MIEQEVGSKGTKDQALHQNIMQSIRQIYHFSTPFHPSSCSWHAGSKPVQNGTTCGSKYQCWWQTKNAFVNSKFYLRSRECTTVLRSGEKHHGLIRFSDERIKVLRVLRCCWWLSNERQAQITIERRYFAHHLDCPHCRLFWYLSRAQTE